MESLVLNKAFFITMNGTKFFSNETFHGYIGRLSIYKLLPPSIIKRQLFGGDGGTVPICFLTRPAILVARQSFDKIEVNKIIKDHTLFDYFMSFVSSETKLEIEERLWYPRAQNWSIQTAIFGYDKTKESDAPRYCPLCVKEQMNEVGEFYFDRLHQIPSILVCTKHKCYLQKATIEPEDGLKHPHCKPTLKSCPIERVEYCKMPMVVEIAKICAAIAEGTYKIDFDYKKRARKLGYILGKYVDQSSIRSDYNKFFYGQIASSHPYNRFLFMPEKFSNPYRHILFDFFLSEREKEGLVHGQAKATTFDRIYFGNGPWKCINKICEWYDKDTIHAVSFNYSRKVKRTIGRFKCSCGVEYSRCYVIKNGTMVRIVTRVLAGKHFFKKGELLRIEWPGQ